MRYPRGRTLGGRARSTPWRTSAGTGRSTIAGPLSGAAGWGFADLLPYFRRSEQADGHDPALRGTSGPVRIEPGHGTRTRSRAAFVRALADAGHPVTDDLSGAGQEGVAWADLAIADGERVSSADAYLRPVLDRPNLTVATDCLVTRLHVRPRPVHRRQLSSVTAAPARPRPASEVILCRGRDRLAAAAHAVRHRPGRPAARPGHRRRRRPAGVGANLRTTRGADVARRHRHRCPRASTTTARPMRRCAATSPASYPDLHLFPILLPLAPARLRAAGRGLRPGRRRWWPRTAGARSGSPPPTRRLAPLIDPAFLADDARPGPDGSSGLMAREARGRRPRSTPCGRPRCGLARSCAPGPTCGPTSGARRQLLPSGRNLPAGLRSGRRRRSSSCGSAGWTGLRVVDASVHAGHPQRAPERHRPGHRRASRRPAGPAAR